MRRLVIIPFLALALAMSVSACGGGSSLVTAGGTSGSTAGASSSTGATSTATATATAGNWLWIATSNTVNAGNSAVPVREYTFLRGAVTPSGNAIAAAMRITQQNFPSPSCYASETLGMFTGSIDGNTLTLTLPETTSAGVMTITATATSATSFLGAYTTPPGLSAACPGDSGTVYGVYVPPISGTWSGTLSSNQTILGPPPQKHLAYSYATTAYVAQEAANLQGVFPLTGVLTFQSSVQNSCFASANIDDTLSYIKGEEVVIVTKPDANGAKVMFSSPPYPSLDNPSAPTEINAINYSTSGGACFLDSGTGTLMLSHP